MPATPIAGRKKVRCPKCTASFSEPKKAIFECPICSCRLSANGVVASTVSFSGQGKEREAGQPKAANGSVGSNGIQEGCSMDGNDTQRGTHTEVCKENRSPNYKEEQQPVTQREALHVEGKPSIEDPAVDLYESKENQAKGSSSVLSSFSVDHNEVLLKAEDSIGRDDASNKRLDLETFRTTRCEFSFKYSLEGVQPVASDSSRKRLPPSKFSRSLPDNEASDVHICTPLRVRISNKCEESSDQSEHGRYSFSSDTGSHDGSESDFDFPAPWADGLQDKVLPDSFGQEDLIRYDSEEVVSATPHLLELLDVYAANFNENVSQEPMKHSEKSDTELPLQAGVGDNEKENEQRDNAETSSFDCSSKVTDLVNAISVVKLNHDEDLVESLAATISFNNQDPQHFVSTPLNISAVDEARSISQYSRVDMQASDLGIASVGGQTIATGMVNDTHFSVLQGPLPEGLLQDMDKEAHTFAEFHTREQSTSDHHPLQGTEMELDLYSHQKVDEWQHGQLDYSPSNADCYTPIMENQSLYPDVQQKERHPGVLSDYAASSVPLANSQPYVVASRHVSDRLTFGMSSSNQMYSYQVPLQPSLIPATIQDHCMVAPGAYHTVSNTCMLCSHHQQPYIQTCACSHCAICQSHSGSIAWNSGHADQWTCHQAHHDPFPPLASSLAACVQRPTKVGPGYGLPSTDVRMQAYLSGKLSQYPPLPKDNAVPYFSCQGCNRVLQVPFDLPSMNGYVQRLRCSACGRVNKFSARPHLKQHQVLPFLEVDSMGGVANVLPAVQYNSCSTVSFNDERLLPMSSWQHEKSSGKKVCQVDANVIASRVSPPSFQEGTYLGSKQRDCTVDSSPSLGARYFENSSSVNGMVSAVRQALELTSSPIERRRQDAVSSLQHVAVDEKDEGLDFGAPRISDGDSLDQSESRMRSPENIQAENACPGPPEGVASRREHQVSKLDQNEEPNLEDQGRTPGSPLHVLLNQESTRFMLTLDPRAPSEAYKSASDSPSSGSMIQNHFQRKERASSQSCKKVPKYIAGLLRRSLKDFSKGGQ
ncbi:hypothetical protein L7F22_001793 [Adiantum nelumboides]|nr:hypothetical protein [Adiantum nelumboides]